MCWRNIRNIDLFLLKGPILDFQILICLSELIN